MALDAKGVLQLIKDKNIQIVDTRFTDLFGGWQHYSLPASRLTEDMMVEGLGFDGSSIKGFQAIHESDMLMIPDPSSAFIDPYLKIPTLVLICDVIDPLERKPYSRDPRNVAKKAEAYLKTTGIADTAYFGPEAEFFLFSDVRFNQTPNSGYYFLDSPEGIWNSGKEEEGGNKGYRVRYKEGYFPTPPTDTLQDIRSEMILKMADIGIDIELHHHEVATAGQCEIDMRYDTLLKMADQLQKYKYVVRTTAKEHGLSATFMPKPIFGDNGSGMHVHQSLWKDGQPLFFDKDKYALLSDTARWYIGSTQARSSLVGDLCADDQQLPPLGPRLRSTYQLGLLCAQSFGCNPHPNVLQLTQGASRRSPLPRSNREPILGVCSNDDGRSRRHPKQGRATRGTQRRHL